ncbi:hypothetical protein FGO68_gene15453 [Halteria grandinella]|uniref:Uncharacterized protein n=1 Tax=Halteria grandinella TaxID=5974 RepID=A0A8J8NT60_HALGN|nr:hypothetical protein FGO68_gene15453 [Halteria grandinella]
MCNCVLISCAVIAILAVLGANVTLLAVSVIIVQSNAFNYGAVIQQESADWGKGAITEIITSEEGCPKGYETVTGQFPGTRTYCKAGGIDYKKSCQEMRIKGTNSPGVEAANLESFFGTHFCIKRNQKLTYHSLVQNRNISKCPNTTCGSPNNAYCQSDACPLNGLFTDTSHFDWTVIDQELMQKYELFPDTANSSNNPLVTIEFRLSRPCGLLRDSYVNRNKEIDEYYNVQQCNFQYNGSHEHVLYYPTKFKEVEYKVYKQNDYLGRIDDMVPNFKAKNLFNNSYSLYYRPYSNWSPKCQAKYSTKTINEKSKLYDVFRSNAELSSKLLFGWIPFFFLTALVLAKEVPCCNYFIPLLFYIFSIPVAVYLGRAHQAYKEIDMGMHRWIVGEGDCSEGGMLQAAFAQFLVELKYYVAIFYTQFIIFFIFIGLKCLWLYIWGMYFIIQICKAIRNRLDQWRDARNYRPRKQRIQSRTPPMREEGKEWDKAVRVQHEGRDLVEYKAHIVQNTEDELTIQVQDVVLRQPSNMA